MRAMRALGGPQGVRRPRTLSLTQGGRWRALAPMAAVVLGLHAVGFFLLIVVVAGHSGGVGVSGAFGIGVGVTAYALGLRHAFDADHIAAIDNTTRKLADEGRPPVSVGFFFSLGHSSVVFALSFLFAIGMRALAGQVESSGSQLHGIAAWVGTGVSGLFLYLIAALNIAILVGVVKVFRRLRDGSCEVAELERQLASRGLMSRFFGRLTRMISRPAQMYPIGVLFGLGFDTASEVALLLLAAGAAGVGLPFYAILCLPILFAAGMSLLDTLDGCLMSFAYGWALRDPVRRAFCNMLSTGLSVVVALAIGTVELTALLAQRLGAEGPFWSWVEGIDIGRLGFAIVGLFAVIWIAALLLWRVRRLNERWRERDDPLRIQA